MPRYWVETLGCPKNQVDSDKLTGTLVADGYEPASSPDDADVIVVNTCAFIDAARQESVETVLALADVKGAGARLVVTGCMAERYGDELAQALPEADLVAGFGVPVTLGSTVTRGSWQNTRAESGVLPVMDLLNLPRPKSDRPWAYVKIAEGCDRSCGFCAIPSFRGPQRSRDVASILQEVDELAAQEIVLVAQDLASYGKDRSSDTALGKGPLAEQRGAGSIVPLVRAVAERVPRVRLLYLYPSDLTDELIDVVGAESGVAYYDLSLQHVSKPLLRRMRRWGDGDRFLRRINDIRDRYPDAAFRSNFIVGYPGETEADHDELLRFVDAAQLDWVGFFSYSEEEGTYAAELDGKVDPGLVQERLNELKQVQDDITEGRRRALVGQTIEVMVDIPGEARSHREAPEIDGVVEVPESLPVGEFAKVTVTGAFGPDVAAVPV